MADEQDCGALFFKFANNIEEFLGFRTRNRGCWLIQKQNAGFGHESLGNFDQLHLSNRKVLHQFHGINGKAERIESLLGQFAALALINHTKTAGLILEDDVLCDGEVRNQVAFLVDDTNTRFSSFEG